jgi:hypothetical protein
MRILGAVALRAALGDRAISLDEVRTRLGQHHLGQNVDILAIYFWPPARMKIQTCAIG